MALITAVCLFQQIVLLLIHTHRQPPLARINNVRPSSLCFFLPTLYSAKCLNGNLGLLLVRFSIDQYEIYFKSVKQHVQVFRSMHVGMFLIVSCEVEQELRWGPCQVVLIFNLVSLHFPHDPRYRKSRMRRQHYRTDKETRVKTLQLQDAVSLSMQHCKKLVKTLLQDSTRVSLLCRGLGHCAACPEQRVILWQLMLMHSFQLMCI